MILTLFTTVGSAGDSEGLPGVIARSLDEEAMAKQIYEEQKLNNWPGLVKETESICKSLDIENVNSTNMSKKEYRKLAISACKAKDEETLRGTGNKSDKCQRIMLDQYGQKEYLRKQNIHKARELFRTRTMMQKFAGNFSHDRRFAATGWQVAGAAWSGSRWPTSPRSPAPPTWTSSSSTST